MSPTYPDPAKSDRKDSLVPDPQDFDLSDPDRARVVCESAAGRLDLFGLLTVSETG